MLFTYSMTEFWRQKITPLLVFNSTFKISVLGTWHYRCLVALAINYGTRTLEELILLQNIPVDLLYPNEKIKGQGSPNPSDDGNSASFITVLMCLSSLYS